MEDRSRLEGEIRDAAKFVAERPAPPNEAATCEWVILPILRALGYKPFEILPEDTSGPRGGRPDYTILPGTQHTWFIEAKAWNVPLESTHANQAISYAHADGRRWVLLTNGREWRLYDDTITGKSEDRLVVSAGLEDPDACVELLSFMSRSSVVDEQVEGVVALARVRQELDRQLRDARSPVVRGIAKALSGSLGFTPSLSHVVAYFNADEEAPAPPRPSEIKREPPAPEPPKPTPAEGYEVRMRGRNGVEAFGIWTGRQLIIRTRSRVNGCPVPSYVNEFRTKNAPKLAESATPEGEFYILDEDVTFGSPSGAADFVNARSTDGWKEWHLLDGRPLNAVRQKKG